MSSGRSRAAALRARPSRQPGDQQQDGADQHRQAQGGGPMHEQAGGHHRRDAEVRPVDRPGSRPRCRTSCAVTSATGRRSPAARSPTSRIQARPPPKTTSSAASSAARRAPRPRSSVRARPWTSRASAPARMRRRGHEGGDGEQAGRLGRDGGVEVGEPVVDQRLAGEVRHLRREVAGVQRLGDRQVDAQVAPVRPAGGHAVRRRVPQAAVQHQPHERRAPGGDGEGDAVASQRRCGRLGSCGRNGAGPARQATDRPAGPAAWRRPRRSTRGRSRPAAARSQ